MVIRPGFLKICSGSFSGREIGMHEIATIRACFICNKKWMANQSNRRIESATKEVYLLILFPLLFFPYSLYKCCRDSKI